MPAYANHHGNSGVVHYEIYDESICVTFKGGRSYLFTYDSAGEGNVEKMKELAVNGRKLATFISEEVYGKHESTGC